MKLKPIEVKNLAFGTVRIVDPSTQGAPLSNAPKPTSDTKVAWHIYGFALAGRKSRKKAASLKAAEEESATSFCIYLPPYSLMFNGTYLPVDPIRGVRGNNDFYDITTIKGDLLCSIYKDGGGALRAKLALAPVPNAIFTFIVCSVAGTEKGASVSQFASGTLTLYSGGKPFDPIVALAEPANGGDGGGSEEVPLSRALSASSEAPLPATVTGFTNCYWMAGGILCQMEDQASPGDDGFIALKIPATTDSGQASLVLYETVEELQSAQRDPAYFTVPLYKMENGLIAVDFRPTPQAQVAEVL